MSGELPSGWVNATVNDIAEINPSGSTIQAPDTQFVTFLPMASVEELSGKIDLSLERPFGEVKKGFTRFRESDVLFAKITPSMENGKVAVARGLRGGIGCGTTEFHVVRPVVGVAPDWLRWFLVRTSFRQEAKRNMQGAVGQQRVPPDFIRESNIPVAPAAEQHRVVSRIDELFSRIDEGERALARVGKLVERYRQSVLKAAVTGELTRDWRAARKAAGEPLESGQALLERILVARREAWEAAELAKLHAKGKPPANDAWKKKYKPPHPPDTTDLPDLPEGWVWARFEQLGFVESGSTPPKVGDYLSEHGSIPWFKVSSMNDQGNEVILTTSKWRLASEAAAACKLKVLPQGTIVFPKRGGAILTNKKRTLGVPGALDLNTMGFVPVDVLGGYMKVLFDRLDLKTIYDGSNVPQINYGDVADLIVALPGTEECVEIASRATSYLIAGSVLMREIEVLRHQSKTAMQAILKAAFTGQLVPQDPNDEPASALLERIAAERATAAPAKARRGRKRADSGSALQSD